MRALLLLLALGACAAAPEPRADAPATPRAVTLWPDTVTARMSDGSLCAASRDGGSGPWNATFRGCPHAWPVEVRRVADRPRLPLAPAVGAPWVVLRPDGAALGYAPRPGT